MADEDAPGASLTRRTQQVRRYAVPGAIGLGTAGFLVAPEAGHLIGLAAHDVGQIMPGFTPHVVEGTIAALAGTVIAGTYRAGSTHSTPTSGRSVLAAVAAGPAIGVVGGLAAHSTEGAVLGGLGGLVAGVLFAGGLINAMTDKDGKTQLTSAQGVSIMRRLALPPLVVGAAGALATVIAHTTGMNLPDIPVAETVGILGLGAAAPPTLGWLSAHREQRRPTGALGE